MNETIFSGSLYPKTQVKAIVDRTVYQDDHWRKWINEMGKKMVNIHYDNLKYSIKPPTIIGIDLGRDDMYREGEAPVSYREQQLEKKLTYLQENHLGAQTERFIAMARELGQNDHLRKVVDEMGYQLAQTTDKLARATEQVAYSDNETQKANKRANNWENNYYDVERRYEAYKKKNAPKKPAVKKASKK